jgi:hypothetical protein
MKTTFTVGGRMNRKQVGAALIVVGAVGAAVTMFAGNQAGLWFVSLVVLGVGLFLRLKK